MRHRGNKWSTAFLAKEVKGHVGIVGALTESLHVYEHPHMPEDDTASFAADFNGMRKKSREEMAGIGCASCSAKYDSIILWPARSMPMTVGEGSFSESSHRRCEAAPFLPVPSHHATICMIAMEGPLISQEPTAASEENVVDEWERFVANEGEAVFSWATKENSSDAGLGAKPELYQGN